MQFTLVVGLIFASVRQAAADGTVHTSSVHGEASVDAQANPIRKVVNLLQAMQRKVSEEAEKEEALFEKFMCYCKTSRGDLEESIANNDAKIPEVESAINEAVASKTQLDADLKKHQTDRDAAKMAMAEATALREKEAKAFATEKAEYDSNIQAITAAVSALEKGMAGFLQTGAATVLKKLAVDSTHITSDADRQTLIAFLTSSQGHGYAPASSEIVGILKEIGGDMAKNLADAIATENGAISNYDQLMQAKTQEVKALTAAIEEKSVRVGEVAVNIAHMKNELTDAQAALLDDKKFLSDLDTGCSTKEAEWDEIKQTRAQELVAIADTIKILQDDDALELFKKTLPSAASASLVQIHSSMTTLKNRALKVLRAARKGSSIAARPKLDFIMLALNGKQIGFDKVIKMIDDMIALLNKEQADDDSKKTYCEEQLDASDDTKKGLEHAVSDSETAIADAEEQIAALVAEMKALKEGITALDKSVVEATEQRQKENEEFKELIAENSKAKELIGFAKNRLNKFYNPKLYVAPPKRDLGEAGAAAFVQIALHRSGARGADAPPPPPATFSAYSAKGQESTGVISMLDMLVKDLDKEMTEAETNEKDAQADYEKMTADAAEKRAADTSALAAKASTKADTEVALEGHKESKASASKELQGMLQYISSLHGECDWLMQNFDVRKNARASESDALANAKAVLKGADFSMLVQTGSDSHTRPSSNVLLRGAKRM